jgi:radical SAM superfamily enzyme YgiQ (UPF0313 family)
VSQSVFAALALADDAHLARSLQPCDEGGAEFGVILTGADLIALSFFSGFAPGAYRLAQIFKASGKRVVAGGPHVSFWPEEALAHGCDAVVQATRGCPFTCSFCSAPSVNPGFRVRPVAEVVRGIQYDDFPLW